MKKEQKVFIDKAGLIRVGGFTFGRGTGNYARGKARSERRWQEAFLYSAQEDLLHCVIAANSEIQRFIKMLGTDEILFDPSLQRLIAILQMCQHALRKASGHYYDTESKAKGG